MQMSSPRNEENSGPQSETESNLFLFWVLPGVLALACLVAYAIVFRGNPAGEPESWGQFGDFFGGLINPVVGMITIILLVKTFRAQQEELRSQLAQAQESGDALKRQAEATALQSFEQTLFTWFGNYKQIVHGLHTREFDDEGDLKSPRIGIDAVRSWASKIRFSWVVNDPLERRLQEMVRKRADPGTLTQSEIEEAASILMNKWEKLMADGSHELRPAIRTLFGIFKWISSHPEDFLSMEKKRLYSGIIRAQLTDKELQLLFFNGLSKRGEAFSSLANEFALFDNLDNPDDFRFYVLLKSSQNRYESAAFGANPPALLSSTHQPEGRHGKCHNSK